jgi:chemotaxis protein CheX
MNVRYLNPFIEAAAEVLHAEVGASITRGPVTLHRSLYTARDVTVTLSLIGRVDGMVLYGLSTATALQLVSCMMGDTLCDMDELAQSGIAELGNVITGRASIKLAQAGYECNISTPTVILGADTRIATPELQLLAVPLQTQYGDIDILLALREGNASSTVLAAMQAMAGQ